MTSWQNWIDAHCMAHEVLPQCKCEPVSLTCKLLQRNKISSDHCNNIMVSYTSGDIILDPQIKTCDGWVARVNFLQETHDKMAQSAIAQCKKNIKNLHVELRHFSESITHATTKALVSKSLVLSYHMKIALWVKQSNEQSVKKLFLIRKFCERSFSSTLALFLLPLLVVNSTGYSS